MDQIALAIPQGGPLNTWHHIIKGEVGIQVPDRVLENLGWINRSKVLVDLLGELKVAE
jgi:hypothetical protein